MTCFLTHLHGDLPNGPGGIVTHRDKFWVQVEPQNGHELSWREDMDTHWLQHNHSLTHNSFTVSSLSITEDIGAYNRYHNESVLGVRC